MDWEPATLPCSSQERAVEQAGSLLLPAPALLAPRRELAAASQCHQQEGAASEQNQHWDRQDGRAQTCTLTQGHTDRAGRAGAHTLTGTALAVTGV